MLERDQAEDLVNRMVDSALVCLDSIPSPAARLRYPVISNEEYTRVKERLPAAIAAVLDRAIGIQ